MGFLEFVSEDLRERVSAILKDDILNYNEKIVYLRGLISDENVLEQVLMCLEKPKVSPPDPNAFLSIMSSHRKLLAEMALQRKDFKTLDKFVSYEEESVKVAYSLWKKKNQKMTEAQEELLQDEDISYPDNDTEETSDESPSPGSNLSSGEQSISLDLFESFPDGANILILGCTGTGKSTFINSLANYLKHPSFEAATHNGVEILIETSFDHVFDDQYARKRITCKPTVFVEKGEDNEILLPGEAATQFPRSYKFSWGPPGRQKTIRIIDTPGVNDVRGADKEKENFKNTLKFIAGFSELHAILILLKANDSRCTQAFRYCVNELLAHLHESASRNIIFCVTHNVTPGDTLSTLEAHLNNLERTRKIKIPLGPDNMFCFDNESFRALCAMTKGVELGATELAKHKRSWVRAVSVTLRMFQSIAQLPVHKVNDTLSVNNIRAVILALARPLAEKSREIITNSRIVNDKRAEINDLINEGKDLKNKLTVDQQVIQVKEIDYPITVCNGSECVSYETFSPDTTDMQKVFKKECHPHCYLQDVEDEVSPNPALKNCWAIVRENCRICKCPWTTHMHIKYHLMKSMKPFIDHTVQNSINNKADQVKEGRKFIEVLENRVRDLENESNKISKYSAEFSAFLKKNSLLSYNDAYGDYIRFLIQEERDKVSLGAPNDVLQNLEKFRDDYIQEVAILTKHDDGAATCRSVDEIYQLVEELKNMTSFGTLLQTVQNIEFVTVRNQEESQSVAVNLNSGSFVQSVKKNNKLLNKFKRLFNE